MPPSARALDSTPRYSDRFAEVIRLPELPIGNPAESNLLFLRAPAAPTRRRTHERVLLVQAGDVVGVGLLHIAAFLRRNGIEAYVAAYRDEDYAEWGRQLDALLDSIRPTLVGIGFKWYNEVIAALWVAEFVKQRDPDIVTVMGGNTAAGYIHELLSFGHVDFVVRGDGELPMLQICQGDDPLNTAYLDRGSIRLGPIAYVQKGTIDEQIYLSHLEEMCPRLCDLMNVPNFIVGGKGCAQACLYCSGGRDKQRELFGRKGPFLRRPEDVRRDVTALHPYVGSFFFDFSSEHDKRVSLVDWFKAVFDEIDCSGHTLQFLPWELPDDVILQYLTTRFRYVTVGVDIGTLSERHRNYLASHGFFKRYLIKKNLSNKDFLDWSDRNRGIANLSLCLTAISGMPFLEESDLAEERVFASQILERDTLALRYEGHRLHYEPGSPVVENQDFFQMKSPINSFRELVEWFESGKGVNDPFMRFKSEALEELVEKHSRQMALLANGRIDHIFRKYLVPWNAHDDFSRNPRTASLRLKRERYRAFTFTPDEWLGRRLATGSPQRGGQSVLYVKNLANRGVRIDDTAFTTEPHGARKEPFTSQAPATERRNYGALANMILDRFDGGAVASDVVRRCVATMPVRREEVCAFISNGMRNMLLHSVTECPNS